MTKNSILFLAFSGIFSILFLGCNNNSDDPVPVFDPVKQARIDDSILVSYLQEKNLTDSFTKAAYGYYFRITKTRPDSILMGDSMVVNRDTAIIKNGNKVFLRYEGRLLNDTLFDANWDAALALNFYPGRGRLIGGFEEGILNFRKLEEGYLLIPSRLAYGNTQQGKIPKNACVRFFIKVPNVER